MKVKITLWIAGKTFVEVVQSKDYEDAKRTALSRNPTAKVIAITAVY